MDEDGKIIEELREINEYQRAQVLHLEKALKQAIASQEEIKMLNNNEMQKSKELIDDLNKKLANCMKTLDAKNIELVNLQTALGQYFAEIEAKVKKKKNSTVKFYSAYHEAINILIYRILFCSMFRNMSKVSWCRQEKNQLNFLGS